MMQEKIQQDKTLLEKQLFWLNLSFEECSQIGIKTEYSIDEFGRFETLCSRYSRSIDFLIRKIFRTIDAFEFENQGALVDVVNNAHKRGLVKNIDELRLMKDVRNTIVHEYVEEELINVFEEVLYHSEELLKMIKHTVSYLDKLA